MTIDFSGLTERQGLAAKGAELMEQLNAELRDVHDNDVLEAIIEPLRLTNPRAVAQLFMTNLASPMGDDDVMNGEDKLFWAEAAIHMGPNWIARFRAIGAFMALVDGFSPRKA